MTEAENTGLIDESGLAAAGTAADTSGVGAAPKAPEPEAEKPAASEPEKAADPILRTENTPVEDAALLAAHDQSEALRHSEADRTLVNPGLETAEGKLAQHDQVDEENARRNEQNAEPFAKLVEADEKAFEEGAAQATEPPTGKARDLNTPTILSDGTKVW